MDCRVKPGNDELRVTTRSSCNDEPSLQHEIRRWKAAQFLLDPALRRQAARAAGHHLPVRVILHLRAEPRPVARQAAARVGDAAVMAAAEAALADVPERQHVAIKLLDR